MSRNRHKNISVEQIRELEKIGLVHAGYDPVRDKEIFHRAIETGCTADPEKLACEFVNNSKWDLRIAQVDGDRVIPFNSGSIVFLPFGYKGLQVQHRDGSPYAGNEILINYGDAMHKGNKLPSRPEPKVKAYRRHN